MGKTLIKLVLGIGLLSGFISGCQQNKIIKTKEPDIPTTCKIERLENFSILTLPTLIPLPIIHPGEIFSAKFKTYKNVTKFTIEDPDGIEKFDVIKENGEKQTWYVHNLDGTLVTKYIERYKGLAKGIIVTDKKENLTTFMYEENSNYK